jgi:hypothetical protein
MTDSEIRKMAKETEKRLGVNLTPFEEPDMLTTIGELIGMMVFGFLCALLAIFIFILIIK